MISASKEFINKLNKDGICVNYADITLSDGTVLKLDYSDFMASGNSVTDKTTTGKFSIGNVIGKTCTLTIANHDDRFSSYDFYNAIVYLYVGMKLDDGTIEKVRKGKYYIVEPATAGDTIVINGVDSIQLFNRDYDSTLSYPATLKQIVTDACLKCGVNISNGFDFPNSSLTIKSRPEETTYMQVLTWISEIACSFFRMNVNDNLVCEFFSDKITENLIYDGGKAYGTVNDEVLDGGDFTFDNGDRIVDGGDFLSYTDDDGMVHVYNIKSLSVSTDDVQITGIKVVNSDKAEFDAGSEGYVISIKNNPLVDGHEQTIANYVFYKVKIYKFRPLSAQIKGNPLLEPFEVGFVHDRKGNQYFACINSVTYSTSGYTTIECKAESPIGNKASYYSVSASEIIQTRRETDRKLSAYDQAVQRMNLLAANSMGVFTSEEELSDGSKIYYMHDKKERSQSTIIYKMTQDGFFVSQNGGASYTAGFDNQGNAVLNVLSVIGITFDWAKGGTLEIGGYNNTNGVIEVKNTSGKTIGKWDCNGIDLTGGSIDGNSVSVNNLNANNINRGGIDASKITVSNISASNITSGTMSANKISGGTLSVGAYNNANGVIEVKDAAGTVVGRWNKDGITLSKGNINASNMTITNLSASSITSGTMSANKIEGGTLDMGGQNNEHGQIIIRDNVGTQVGKWDKDGISISSGSIDASKCTISNLSAGDIHGGTLKMGGTNNVDGVIHMYNGSNELKGIWDKDCLYVIGGKLQGGMVELGGDDNFDGKLIIYDKNNSEIGRWDRDGINVSTGKIKGVTIESNNATITGGSINIETSYEEEDKISLSYNDRVSTLSPKNIEFSYDNAHAVLQFDGLYVAENGSSNFPTIISYDMVSSPVYSVYKNGSYSYGATGSFTDRNGRTVNVSGGIITSIS